MNPHQWEKVKQIFADASELPEGQRAAHVDRACDGDLELRSEVEALLSAAERTGGGGATVDHEFASMFGAFESAAGSVIGPYRLLQPIGEGGFGTVWLAEQRHPVVRQVALKIIKLGMDTRQVTARFEAERQALAMMDHPNIARVFDAGATDTGRPYFVMELVKGVPITQYCDQNNLSIRRRLELLMPVCQAVQHAHQKSIIHRDIKPSNVLVTIHDGLPVPKVIDFGIAKAVSHRLTDKTVFTDANQMIGTPAYMSPEQARMTGLDIDTRADIYSLGVLIYELLTGVTPFDTVTLQKAAYDEIQRMIREVEPPKPSTRLNSLAGLPSVAARRQVDPKKLSQLVRGELDWIVMKCLEKDRARRYETADALRSDLSRYLSDQPVLAGPPSKTYRMRKFVRRNRAAVATVAAALLITAAGIAFYVHSIRAEQRRTELALREARRQQAEAEKQRSEAQAQQRQAQQQAAIAQAVGRFLTDMLATADPQRMFGDKVTVLQAVTAAVKQLDGQKLKDQPLVEAAVRDTIGNTLRALGRYDAAEVNLQKGLELRRRELPRLHVHVAASLNNLARLKKAQGKLAEAEPLFREALEINRQMLPPSDPDLAGSMNNFAVLLFSQGRASESEALLRQALDVCRAGLPTGHPDTAATIANLSAVLQAQGNLKQAEPLLLEALEMMRAARPAGHPDIALALNNLATLLRDQGNFAGAEPLLREALAISRAVMPAVHPDVALAVTNLATIQHALGKFAEAEAGFREGLWIREQLLDPDHPDIGKNLENLARSLEAQGKQVEAEPLMRRALEIRRTRRGADAEPTRQSGTSTTNAATHPAP